MCGVQHAEFWPKLPVSRCVERYAFDEKSASGLQRCSRVGTSSSAVCTKHPTKPHDAGRGHGLLTGACCNCWRLTGFSIMTCAESPKTVFELLVTRLSRPAAAPSSALPDNCVSGGQRHFSAMAAVLEAADQGYDVRHPHLRPGEADSCPPACSAVNIDPTPAHSLSMSPVLHRPEELIAGPLAANTTARSESAHAVDTGRLEELDSGPGIGSSGHGGRSPRGRGHIHKTAQTEITKCSVPGCQNDTKNGTNVVCQDHFNARKCKHAEDPLCQQVAAYIDTILSERDDLHAHNLCKQLQGRGTGADASKDAASTDGSMVEICENCIIDVVFVTPATHMYVRACTSRRAPVNTRTQAHIATVSF